MAQDRQDRGQLPDAGETRQNEGKEPQENAGALDEARRATLGSLNRLSLLRHHRLANPSFNNHYTIDLKDFVSSVTGGWNGVLMQGHKAGIEPLLRLGYADAIMPIWSGARAHRAEITTDTPPFLAAATEAVREAKTQVAKAQEQLKQALEVEQAMLELAQLREVRKAHDELYGPDKTTGLTAAQEYLAFKKNQREQQSTSQQYG